MIDFLIKERKIWIIIGFFKNLINTYIFFPRKKSKEYFFWEFILPISYYIRISFVTLLFTTKNITSMNFPFLLLTLSSLISLSISLGTSSTVISCFSDEAKIIVLESGVQVEKPITEVNVADEVLTLSGSELKTTKVIRNLKISGSFEFLEIEASSQNGTKKLLKVTPNHVMIRAHDNMSLKLLLSKNLKLGDKVLSEDGVYVVSKILNTMKNDKYKLVTTEGTVLASGVFVSTICGPEILCESDFDDVLASWKQKYRKFLIN